MSTISKASIADLVAKYGSSSSTAWLEFDRYKLWQPSEPVLESSFIPVQGYMEKDPYIFAWGNPLVSDTSALPNVARQFVRWCEAQGKRPVWCCVDVELEEVLASEILSWSTVLCVHEDVVDPAHIIELTSPESKGQEGQKTVKDLKKNLARAEKYHVKVSEVLPDQWTEEDKISVEQGIRDWKSKRQGMQIASTTGFPWLDSEHRRYWVASKGGEAVGILILTPIRGTAWQIKNAISFPSAPKGTSEALIHTTLKDLHAEEEEARQTGCKVRHPANDNFERRKIRASTTQLPPLDSSSSSSSNSASLTSLSDVSTSSKDAEDEDHTTPSSFSFSDIDDVDAASVNDDAKDNGVGGATSDTSTSSAEPSVNGSKRSSPFLQTHCRGDPNQISVTFGLSAAPKLEPVHNLGGWKVSALSKTYGKVINGAKLVQRGEFRSKFDSFHQPMYVCYPPDGFGLEGVNALLKVLRK